MNDSEPFGARIARLRKKRKLSQASLGSALKASQATVSRIEASETPPSDVRLISQLAQTLGVTVTDLLDGMAAPSVLTGDSGDFYAFCANPVCDSNETGRNPKGNTYVKFKSGQLLPANVYDETNYCVRCGEGLVKNCPSCGKRLKQAMTRFCSTCGAPVSNRPTAEDWKKISALHPTDKLDEDIPF